MKQTIDVRKKVGPLYIIYHAISQLVQSNFHYQDGAIVIHLLFHHHVTLICTAMLINFPAALLVKGRGVVEGVGVARPDLYISA
jgi:hypothetical protein